MEVKMIVVERYVEIRDGRLHEILKKAWHYFSREQGAMRKKTKVRFAEAGNRCLKHGHWYFRKFLADSVAKEFPELNSWEIVRCGSDRQVDVHHGLDQFYRIRLFQETAEELNRLRAKGM
jgi:hypothetical protein